MEIKFKIYINNDEELYVLTTINKISSESWCDGGNSAKFEKMLTEKSVRQYSDHKASKNYNEEYKLLKQIAKIKNDKGKKNM